MQSEAKVHVIENVYTHNPYNHYIGKNTFDFTALVTKHAKTGSKSANLGINDACDNVSNVSRAFGCHRNTTIRLRQRFQQTGGVADRRRSVDRGLQTFERTDSLR